MRPSGSSRYSAPPPGRRPAVTVPAQNRPAGSQAPSLNRASATIPGGRSGPPAAWPSAPTSRNPSAAASTYPAPASPALVAARGAAAPTATPAVWNTSSPRPGRYRCSWPARMSTQPRQPAATSQNGRSPSSARAGTATCHSTADSAISATPTQSPASTVITTLVRPPSTAGAGCRAACWVGTASGAAKQRGVAAVGGRSWAGASRHLAESPGRGSPRHRKGGTANTPPLSTYSAPGGLRQGPGRAAEWLAEPRTDGNGGRGDRACGGYRRRRSDGDDAGG